MADGLVDLLVQRMAQLFFALRIEQIFDLALGEVHDDCVAYRTGELLDPFLFMLAFDAQA